MEKHDVLLRASKVLNDLYNEINAEEWTYNEELYNKQMDDFIIVSNVLGELIQYRYVGKKSKEEYKEFVSRLIDEDLK